MNDTNTEIRQVPKMPPADSSTNGLFDTEGNAICPKCGEHLVFVGDILRKLAWDLLKVRLK